jgi:putative peptidoglycan lipid II flippase
VRLPVRVGVIVLFVNVGLDLALVRVWHEFGLALATSVSAFVGAALLAWGLRRAGGGGATGAGRPVAAAVAVTVLMAAVVGGCDALLTTRLGAGDGVRVLAGIGLGLLVFVLLASRLCREEWRELSALWTRDSG